jgi:cysteine synthase A
MIFSSAEATVGNTPLVELSRLDRDLPGAVVAKLECRNPSGSIKDRVAVALVDDAERRGVLRPGMTIIEPTGGNTGIALAMVAAIRGYSLVLTMPEVMSVERVALLRQLGAQIVLTPGILMDVAIAEARRLVAARDDAIMLAQFANPANPEIHRRTTALELYEASGGEIDFFVSAVGTGGTITGVGEILKKFNPVLRVIAVEPAGSAVLSGGQPGPHQMPGIGVGFIAEVLNREIIDEIIVVTDEQAIGCAQRLAREEGIVAGVSSGAALFAALQIAARSGSEGKVVAVILPDSGERYITTVLFQPLEEGADR